MTLMAALTSGFAGACTVTLLNESVRRLIPNAPRMEVIGMRAIAKSMRVAGQEPPEEDSLFSLAMAGDLVSNSLYYSLVGWGAPPGAWTRGVLLGLAAGLGGAFLPGPLGLGHQPGERTPTTQILTIAWYLAGGLAAAATTQALAGEDAS